MKIFDITNTTNYKNELLEEDYQRAISSYETIIKEFITYLLSVFKTQNEKYLLFISNRGIDTIKHCFIQLLTYTKNIDLTFYHCKKAFYYYIEFIGQISEESHSYLQLTSKDATLFVYKKTIFDIDNSFRRNMTLEDKDKIIIENIFNYTELFNRIIINYLHKSLDVLDYNIENIGNNIFKDLKDLLKIIKLTESIKIIKPLILFDNYIKQYSFKKNKYILLLKYLLKKSIKKNTIFSEKKLLTEKCSENIINFSELKFINWLLVK